MISPITDTETDSDPVVWEDCGIAGAAADVVTVDSTCTGADGAAADLKITVTDVCFPSCEEGAPVFVAVQITNQGGRDVTSPVPVAVYAGESAAGSGDVPIHLWTHTAGLGPGERATGHVLEFDVNALGGQAVRIEVNDDGTGEWTVAECDLSNNRAVWDAVPCTGE